MRNIFLLLSLFFSSCLFAQGIDLSAVPAQQDLQQLSTEISKIENHNHDALTALNMLSDEPMPEVVNENDLSRIRVELEQNQITLDTLNSQLADIDKKTESNQKRSELLSSQLQKQSNPLITGTDADALQQSREQTREQLKRNQKQRELLNRKKTAIEQAVYLDKQRKALLESRYQSYNENYLEKSGTPLSSDKHEQLAQLEQNRSLLAEQLKNKDISRDSRLDKNIELALISKQIFYTDTMNELLGLETRLQELQYADLTTLTLARIDRIRNELSAGQQRIETLQNQIESNQHVITEQYSLYRRQRISPPSGIVSRQQALDSQYDKLNTLIENNLINLRMNRKVADREYTQQSKIYLKQQYRFGDSISRLPSLLTRMFKANGMFLGQYAVALQTFYHGLTDLTGSRRIILSIAAAALCLATLLITMLLNRMSRRYHDHKRLTFASRLLYFIITMLKNNLPYLMLLLLTFIAIGMTNIASPASGLILLIPAILIFNSLPYYAARNLIRTELIASPEKKRIIRPLVILAAIGSILFALVLMSQWISDDEVLTDTYRWIFALYNLLVAVPLWLAVNNTFGYMREFYGEHFTYRILNPIIRTVPPGVLVFGAIGTLGYLNFAWILAHYLLMFLLYALLWVTFLAFLKDTSLRAKQYALRNTSNGVFWAQDVINPIHTALLYGSLFFFLHMLQKNYGWNHETPVIRNMLVLFNKPIIGSNSSQFTLLNTVLLAIIIYAIYRIGGWIKSFSYRWIYSKIQDLGIRNSLSVFSQYAIVTLGFLLALRVIGLDLTTFTVFAGALGVGIGFGMQNIANNFISGILLLIERPLRNGDVISVGKYDGTVERIGMRSLTITTFDNETVILPNSDFVTGAFMNWSHTDQIVRTVFYFDINYQHNPAEVEKVLNETMQKLVEQNIIIDMPQPDYAYGVFAYNCSERGITYRVQYYLHMLQQHLIINRHQVIQALWQACYDHGITFAHPKREVFFPGEHSQMPPPFRTEPPEYRPATKKTP